MITTEKKSVRAGNYVNTEHVDTVIRNYKQERWVQNSRRIGKEDSLSVWYSLEDLEGFLQNARQHGADGIKVYFGAYGQEDAPAPLYEDRQTVVFVATKQKENGTGIVNKDIYIGNGSENTILAYNVGTPCPPFCSSGDFEIGITILDKGDDGYIVG